MRIGWIGFRGVPARGQLGGGIERAVEELGSRLASRGHELTVYCRDYYVDGAGDYRGMKRVVIPTVRQKHLDTTVYTALATAHAMARRYDVIQYFALGPSLLSWTPRLTGVPTVASVRGLDWQREKWGPLARRVLQLGERAAIYCPNATTCVSDPLKVELERRYGRPVTHIPNGVACPGVPPPQALAELGLEPGGYILFVGRLVPEKGVLDLVRAFRQVATDKRLVLAGSSSYSEEYVRTVRDEADPRVLFAGQVGGRLLQELYGHAYLCVLPSYVEGLSNALLEALSYDRCVLASDIPENTAVLAGHGVTVPPGDVAGLARELRRLLDDPAEVARRGKASGEHVRQRYTWDAVADATEDLYRTLVV